MNERFKPNSPVSNGNKGPYSLLEYTSNASHSGSSWEKKGGGNGEEAKRGGGGAGFSGYRGIKWGVGGWD